MCRFKIGARRRCSAAQCARASWWGHRGDWLPEHPFQRCSIQLDLRSREPAPPRGEMPLFSVADTKRVHIHWLVIEVEMEDNDGTWFGTTGNSLMCWYLLLDEPWQPHIDTHCQEMPSEYHDVYCLGTECYLIRRAPAGQPRHCRLTCAERQGLRPAGSPCQPKSRVARTKHLHPKPRLEGRKAGPDLR